MLNSYLRWLLLLNLVVENRFILHSTFLIYLTNLEDFLLLFFKAKVQRFLLFSVSFSKFFKIIQHNYFQALHVSYIHLWL